MKDEAKDLALRVARGHQTDVLCKSCLFFERKFGCKTPLPIQYQTVDPGRGMVDCSNYLMSLGKPGRGTSEVSYSDRLVNLWINGSRMPNITTGTMRPDKQREVEKTKREHPEAEVERLSLGIGKNYLSMKGTPTRNLKLRRSMAKYLLRLVQEDRLRMSRFWYVNGLEPIMSRYLETELKKILTKLEGK